MNAGGLARGVVLLLSLSAAGARAADAGARPPEDPVAGAKDVIRGAVPSTYENELASVLETPPETSVTETVPGASPGGRTRHEACGMPGEGVGPPRGG